VPHIDLWEPSCFAKVPDGPQPYVLRPQEDGTQRSVKSKVHTHKECGQRFLPPPHTSHRMDCPTAAVDEDVSSGYYVQRIML